MNLFDTNIFIQHDNFCTRQVFVSLWDWMLNNEHDCSSIKSVYEEISPENGDLKAWADSAPDGYFIDNKTASIEEEYKKVVRYVEKNFPDPPKITAFLGGADPWLIATAIHHKANIITFEKMAGSNSTKPKIPNVAKHFNITCYDFDDFCKEHSIKF